MSQTFHLGGLAKRQPSWMFFGAGAGNIIGSATAWWGLRAYTVASIGGNVIKVRRSSDSTTKTFVSLANGSINTADTFFDGSNYFADTLYDQTGNGRNFVQATAGNQPALILNGQGSLPILRFASASPSYMLATSTAVAQPYTFSAVAKRTANFTTKQALISGQGPNINQLTFAASSNTADIYAGSDVTASGATNSVFNSIHGIFNGASGDININGTVNTVNPGALGADAALIIGSNLTGTVDKFDGDAVEFGEWPVAFSATQSTNLSANQHNYWGF